MKLLLLLPVVLQNPNLPRGCPSSCPQLPLLLSGYGSSPCRPCSACCCHIRAAPYCLSISSKPPVRKRSLTVTSVVCDEDLSHKEETLSITDVTMTILAVFCLLFFCLSFKGTKIQMFLLKLASVSI